MYPTKTLLPPASVSAAKIRWREGRESVMGFSMKTCLPARRAAMQRDSWNSSAVRMKIREMAGLERRVEEVVVWWGMWNLVAQWEAAEGEMSLIERISKLKNKFIIIIYIWGERDPEKKDVDGYTDDCGEQVLGGG